MSLMPIYQTKPRAAGIPYIYRIYARKNKLPEKSCTTSQAVSADRQSRLRSCR